MDIRINYEFAINDSKPTELHLSICSIQTLAWL